MFSRTALMVFCVCVGVTCAVADEKAAANKIFVETVQLLKQAAAAKPSAAVGLYEKALRNLDSIVANYPSSDLAVQIISGQAIGQVSRISIEKALDEARQTTKELEKKELEKKELATKELERKELEKKELEKLRGTWQVSEFIALGKPVPEEKLKALKIVFSGDTMKMSNPGDNSEEEWECKFELDPAKKPKAIDIVLKDVRERLLGIYELDGDTLRWCTGEPTVRPKEFKVPQGSDCSWLVLLKRSKS